MSIPQPDPDRVEALYKQLSAILSAWQTPEDIITALIMLMAHPLTTWPPAPGSTREEAIEKTIADLRGHITFLLERKKQNAIAAATQAASRA